MTNQDLFTRIIDNFQSYDQLQAAIDQDTTGSTDGLHWASGDLLAEQKELLWFYTCSNMVILRCHCCDSTSWVTMETLSNIEQIACEFCHVNCDRLLADGTWQTQAERDQLNQVAYQKVSG